MRLARLDESGSLFDDCDLSPSSATQRWLAGLPPAMRPSYLPMIFPSIADNLASLGADRPTLDKYFWGKRLKVESHADMAIVNDELRLLHAYSVASRVRPWQERTLVTKETLVAAVCSDQERRRKP